MQWILALFRTLRPFVVRDLREQYAGSRLGIAWSLLQPLMLILLYWLVFSAILKIRVPAYAAAGGETPFIVFLLAAMLPWFAFSEGLNRGATAILARRNVVKSVVFPVQVFPVSLVTASFLVNLFAYLFYLVAVTLWRGELQLVALLGVALLLLMQWLTVVGFALLFSSLSVYVQDIQHILTLAVQVMFYTAPILYPISMIPEQYRGFMMLNPFTGYAVGYRDLVLGGVWPEWSILLQLGLFALAVLLLGRYVFQRLQPGFSDVL